jgi:hypothetical protein
MIVRGATCMDLSQGKWVCGDIGSTSLARTGQGDAYALEAPGTVLQKDSF